MSPYRGNVGINHIGRLWKNSLDGSLKCKRFNEMCQLHMLLGERVRNISRVFIMKYWSFDLDFSFSPLPPFLSTLNSAQVTKHYSGTTGLPS